MKLSLKVGTTSKTINLFMQDSSSTTGAGLTGLVFNTASLVAYYALPRAAAVQITLATQTVTGAYSSGGFVEISSANMPGWYRFDIPDAAIASGAFSSIHFKGATNLAPLPLEIELTAWDNQDAVHGGLSALPNAAAAAASGLPVLGTNATLISFTAGMVISNAGGDALQLTSSGSNGNALNAAANGTGAGIKSTGGATGNGLQLVGGATSGSAAKLSGTAGNAIALELAGQGSAAGLSVTGGATGAGAKFVGGGTSGDGIDITTTSGDGLSILPTAGNAIVATANGTSKHGAVITGGTAGTSDGIKAVAGTGGVDIRGAITGNITGNLSGSAGSVTGAVGSVTGAVGSVTGNVGGNVVGSVASVTAGVTVTTNNDKTGYSIASGGIGSGAHAAAELNNIADATLDRNMATGVDSGTDSTAVRTLRQSARASRNKTSITAGVMTVTKEDDTTASWTAAITTTAGNPISTVDPT